MRYVILAAVLAGCGGVSPATSMLVRNDGGAGQLAMTGAAGSGEASSNGQAGATGGTGGTGGEASAGAAGAPVQPVEDPVEQAAEPIAEAPPEAVDGGTAEAGPACLAPMAFTRFQVDISCTGGHRESFIANWHEIASTYEFCALTSDPPANLCDQTILRLCAGDNSAQQFVSWNETMSVVFDATGNGHGTFVRTGPDISGNPAANCPYNGDGSTTGIWLTRQ